MRQVAAMICLFAALTLPAADVQFVWADFGLRTEAMAGRRVTISPLSAPTVSSGSIVTRDRLTYTNDANASFWASNMVDGVYLIEHTGPYTKTKFWINVPDTNIALQASSLIVAPTNLPSAGTVAWSTEVADQRYVRVDDSGNLIAPTNFLALNIVAGTNIFIEYTAHGIIINSGISAETFTYYLLEQPSGFILTESPGGDELTHIP